MPSIGSALKNTSPSSKLKVVSGDERQGFLDRYRNLVARRAYDLFERHGHMDGNDVSNWLDAENELAMTLPEVREFGGTYTVEFALPGLSAEEVQVCAHEDRAIVSAESCSRAAALGGGMQESRSIYYMVRWPEATQPDSASATMENGRLILTAQKARQNEAARKSGDSTMTDSREEPRSTVRTPFETSRRS